MSVLSPELRAWLAPGLAGMIAAVDRSGQPQMARVWALRAPDERDVIEVYVQRAASLTLLESLTNGGRAALNLIEVTTYRSRMFKGACEVCKHETDGAFWTRTWQPSIAYSTASECRPMRRIACFRTAKTLWRWSSSA